MITIENLNKLKNLMAENDIKKAIDLIDVYIKEEEINSPPVISGEEAEKFWEEMKNPSPPSRELIDLMKGNHSCRCCE